MNLSDAARLDPNDPGENIEKLGRLFMVMARLKGTGRNQFFDHAQVVGVDQVPTVTVFSPWIVPKLFSTFVTNKHITRPK